MKKLIKKILREEIEKSDRHYRILDKISDHVQLPYFESMEGLTIYDKDDQEYIMRKIFDNDVTIKGHRYISNDKGYEVYRELKYDKIWWEKREYDDKGNRIYLLNSSGGYEKHEYDDNGHQIYFENYDGEWRKWEYDDRGREIYYEDSDGYIDDNR